MRLFINIYLPKEIRDVLRDYTRKFYPLKQNLVFVETENLHVLLKDIGPKVSDSSYEKVSEYFLENPYQGMIPKITINKLSFGFERETFPKLLLARIQKDNDLLELSNYYHQMIQELKLRDTITWKKNHDNQFHITLARLKPKSTKSASKAIAKHFKTLDFGTLPISFEPDQVYLVESEKSIGKPRKYFKREFLKL